GRRDFVFAGAVDLVISSTHSSCGEHRAAVLTRRGMNRTQEICGGGEPFAAGGLTWAFDTRNCAIGGRRGPSIVTRRFSSRGAVGPVVRVAPEMIFIPTIERTARQWPIS